MSSSATTFPRHNHIISRRLDPFFAIFIGLAAAAVRVRREEIENGRSGAVGDIGAMAFRRAVGTWKGDFGVRGEDVGGDGEGAG